MAANLRPLFEWACGQLPVKRVKAQRLWAYLNDANNKLKTREAIPTRKLDSLLTSYRHLRQDQRLRKCELFLDENPR